MKINLKIFRKEFKLQNYKSELKWFDGAWSRFKPGLGKDKRGVSGVNIKRLKDVGNKIFKITENFKAHKTLMRVFELRNQMEKTGRLDWSAAESLAIGSLLTEGFQLDYQAKTLKRHI